MKHSIKKSEIVDRMGLKLSLKEYDGPQPRNIKVTGNQFDRLLEEYMDYEEFEMGEDFGDGDLSLSDPAAQSMVTQSADDYYMDTESASELDEDMDDEEDLDEMWGALAKMAATAAGTAAGEKLVDKYLEEKHDLMESIKKTYKLIRERIKIERPKGLRLSEYNYKSIRKSFLSESQDEWRGHNPGVSAAAGIENIINSIKKGYDFIKDSRTRKQIANTLTKLNNFMTYTGELVGSGQSQRQPRSYEELANPLPYPELDEPEELEDVDDEINITEAYRRIGVSARNIPKQYRRRLNEVQGINPERIAKEIHDAMDGLGTRDDDFWNAVQPVGRTDFTPAEQEGIQTAFYNLYDQDLRKWIEGDFSGADKSRALKALGY